MRETADSVFWGYLLLLAENPAGFAAVHAAAILAGWCGLGAALHRYEQRRDRRNGLRRLEHFANHPAHRTHPHRTEDQP
ncbi:hypothetical protein ACIQPQ_31530 [Streptomyces sp. NPDC091281]|uniref:hypothetical protein n=1 Tax=Streptomyces sp. NPDC091281 TaxID=3365985 RepID=UPI003809D3CC